MTYCCTYHIVVVLVLITTVCSQTLSSEYCQTMKPDFPSEPQAVPLPFSITVSRDRYTAGSTLYITINSTSALAFRGFLIQARRADESRGLNVVEPIGYFVQQQGMQITCPGYFGNALAHVENAAGYDVEKRSLRLMWTAPTPSQGHIKFRVTVIVSSTEYWVGENSAVIIDPNAPPMPLPTKDPAGSADMGSIDVSECGKTKGCYRNPAGCVAETCDMLVTWTYKAAGGVVDFEITGDSDGWVAVGLSHDKKMGHDDVTECVWNEEKSVVEVRQSYNLPDNRKNVVFQDDQKHVGLLHMEGYMSNDRIRCSFRRTINVNDDDRKFSLDDGDFYMLMTRGDVDEKGNKKIHVLEPGKYPYVTPNKISLKKNLDLSGTCRYPLVKAHGILMVLAWMLCSCTALLMAKYYKPMWPNDRLCNEKVWFAVHRGLMLSVLILTIIAFILIFVHVGGYSWMPFLHEKAHPPLGITVTILVILNPLLAVCRCKDKSRKRPIFNWIHWFLGTCAAVLATPTLFIGLNLPKAHVPWWATWVMVVFMLFHLIIELMLEIHGCVNSRKQKLRDEEFELRKKNDTRGDLYGKEPEPVGRRFKKRILAVYLTVVIILAFIMVIAIAIG